MSLYLFLIILQSLLILAWISYVKYKHSEIPRFDSWLKKMLQYNPQLILEEAFDEYINKFNVVVIRDHDESEEKAIARTKLELIESYDLDAILQGRENYDGYKVFLQQQAFAN